MSDQYEKLLRPYWAYEIIPGKSGFPERFKQFNATRQMAMDELAKDTGIEAPPGHEVGIADFFKMYTSGELPITASQNDATRIRFIENTNTLIEELLKSIDYDEDLEEDPLTDFYEGKAVALEQLGAEACEVASFENDISHSPGLSWHIDFTLFISPIPAVEGGFALLNLDWDDNYGCWEWRCETALTGASSIKEARRYLLGKYKEFYIAGAEDKFRDFLESLS